MSSEYKFLCMDVPIKHFKTFSTECFMKLIFKKFSRSFWTAIFFVFLTDASWGYKWEWPASSSVWEGNWRTNFMYYRRGKGDVIKSFQSQRPKERSYERYKEPEHHWVTNIEASFRETQILCQLGSPFFSFGLPGLVHSLESQFSLLAGFSLLRCSLLSPTEELPHPFITKNFWFLLVFLLRTLCYLKLLHTKWAKCIEYLFFYY